jgi:hypothetical protein
MRNDRAKTKAKKKKNGGPKPLSIWAENPRDVFFEEDIEKVLSKTKARDIEELCIEALED